MKRLIIGLSSILILFIYACSTGHAQSNPNLLPPTEFKKKVEVTEKAIILDVRTPEEYQDGHLANAVNMNWNDDAFDKQIKTLDKNSPVFVYCYGGGRSSSAAKELRKQGFTNVYDLKGGMEAWRETGLPEVK
jgi:thioredoxin 1